jgi:hypothetical protein
MFAKHRVVSKVVSVEVGGGKEVRREYWLEIEFRTGAWNDSAAFLMALMCSGSAKTGQRLVKLLTCAQPMRRLNAATEAACVQ